MNDCILECIKEGREITFIDSLDAEAQRLSFNWNRVISAFSIPAKEAVEAVRKVFTYGN